MGIPHPLTIQFMGLVTVVLLLFSLSVYGFSRLYLQKRFFRPSAGPRPVGYDALVPGRQRPVEVRSPTTGLLPAELVSVYNEKLRRTIFSTDTARTALHEPFLAQLRPGKSDCIYGRTIDNCWQFR